MNHANPNTAAHAHAASTDSHATHESSTSHGRGVRPAPSLNRLAALATLHCLAGCAVGEVLGMMIGTALGLSNSQTILIAVVLAFAFGYAFATIPLRRAGMSWRAAARLALAADTASITIMEIVDNTVMLMIPGAMDAPLDSALFWAALTGSLAIAGLAAFPVNRWLIGRGKGHALAHAHHAH